MPRKIDNVIPLRKAPEPWTRQKGEPPRAWAYFIRYRDMYGTRSIARLAKMLGRKSWRNFERWSSEHHWQARVEAWDAECKRRLLEEHNDKINNMADRHIGISLAMQGASSREIKALASKVLKADAKATSEAARLTLETGKPVKAERDPVLTVNEMLKLLTHGVNLERLTRGEPTEVKRTEQDNTLDLSTLSVEDIRDLKRIHAKAKK